MRSTHSEMPRYKIRTTSATNTPSMNAAISSEGDGKWRGVDIECSKPNAAIQNQHDDRDQGPDDDGGDKLQRREAAGHRNTGQQAGQRAAIPPGKAGEKRRANADDCSMAFGGLSSGNAPIKKAARTPSSKPKIILRALGRMITPRPLNTWRGDIVGTRVTIESTM